jgi:UDP:flavonoid glycosyltransferase YjiC (YdhE family)
VRTVVVCCSRQVAARVAWSGAGVALRTQRPSPERVRRAVRRVLDRRDHRDAAARIARAMAAADAGAAIADLVEGL